MAVGRRLGPHPGRVSGRIRVDPVKGLESLVQVRQPLCPVCRGLYGANIGGLFHRRLEGLQMHKSASESALLIPLNLLS